MRRRTFLSMTGVALSPGLLSGCLSGSPSGSDPGNTDGADDTNTDGTTTDDTTDSTATPSGDSETPTGSDGGSDSRFADEHCPSFVDNADRTVCAHTAADDEPLRLTPSTELFEPSTGDDTVETVTFELTNESEQTVGLNPYEWRIKRQTDDGWTHVAPQEYIEPWYQLEPGQSYRWQLAVEDHPSPEDDDTIQIVEDLQTGIHAFGLNGFVGSESEDEKTLVEWVALFEVAR